MKYISIGLQFNPFNLLYIFEECSVYKNIKQLDKAHEVINDNMKLAYKTEELARGCRASLLQ